MSEETEGPRGAGCPRLVRGCSGAMDELTGSVGTLTDVTSVSQYDQLRPRAGWLCRFNETLRVNETGRVPLSLGDVR